jgi:hypothetical protein
MQIDGFHDINYRPVIILARLYRIPLMKSSGLEYMNCSRTLK